MAFLAAEVRNANENLFLHVAEKAVNKGEKVKVAFKVKNPTDILGLQFTLQFDQLRLDGIQGGVIQNQHIARVSDRALTICWDQLSAKITDQSNGELFKLTFLG